MSQRTTTTLYGIFIAVMVLFVCIAYARVTTELKIEGEGDASEQEGVYITDVAYLTDNGADTDNSTVNFFLGTMLDSKVTLGSSSSSTITYKVTVKNNTDREQVFIGIVKNETNEGIYSNTNIQPNVATAGGVTGIIEYETTIAPGETLTFPVTFAYSGTDTSNTELQSKINFRFREKPIIELSNNGETYTLENIYAGYTPAEYEFTVSNYNQNYTNVVPLTYTLVPTITEGSSLTAKIYDEAGNEVTGEISIAGDGTAVDHTYTLKILWDSTLDSTEYEGQAYTCELKLTVIPDLAVNADLDDYADYKIEQGFKVEITTCSHTWENGTCTTCGKKAPFTADGSWDGTINTPILTEDMTPVAWDEEGNEFTPTTNEEWYNYVAQASGVDGTSNWANAKTSDGSYWVWIPRYEYKVTSQATSGSTAGTIDVNFIPITTNVTSSGYTTTTDINQTVNGVEVLSKGITVSSNGYIIHPAFTSDVDVGGGDSELAGIWVAKYEMSMETNGTATTTTSSNGNVAISSTIKMVSKPGVTSWRYTTVSNMYENALAYDSSKESHLMKNSEWGAVAYLTHSKYGRNGIEVTMNSNSSYYTAGSSKATATTNVSQSSTGNATGVYDLAGGASEYVALFNDAYSSSGSYYKSYKSASGTNMGAIGLANGGSTKYLTAYSNVTEQYRFAASGNIYTTHNAFATGGYTVSITGDAISELIRSGNSMAWFYDTSEFIFSEEPFLRRGGSANINTTGGVFRAEPDYGGTTNYTSFRVCLRQPQIQESCTHTFGGVVTTSTQNCGFDGINKRICSLCGKTEFEITEATGIHIYYGSWVTVKEATCVDTGLQTKTCTVCRDVRSQIIAATGVHTYGDWETTIEATCTTAGNQTRTCTVCGTTETQEIAASGIHTYSGGVCTQCGSPEPIPTSTSYVGCYADMDANGTIDGVIFADQGVGTTGTGEWGSSAGVYEVPTITSGLREYYISQESYTIKSTDGKWDANAHPVISPVKGTTGTDRFYVMALSDFTTSAYSTFYWYYSAYSAESLDNPIEEAGDDFGEGYTKTGEVIEKWNLGEVANGGYGAQNDQDIWKHIQTEYDNGWFVPSMAEWSAFEAELGIMPSTYQELRS